MCMLKNRMAIKMKIYVNFVALIGNKIRVALSMVIATDINNWLLGHMKEGITKHSTVYYHV